MTEQEKEQINRDLTEWLGWTWHDSKSPYVVSNFDLFNEDSNWEYFWFIIWNRAKESEEWEEFLEKTLLISDARYSSWKFRAMINGFINLIGPPFVKTWWRFLKEKEGK